MTQRSDEASAARRRVDEVEAEHHPDAAVARHVRRLLLEGGDALGQATCRAPDVVEEAGRGDDVEDGGAGRAGERVGAVAARRRRRLGEEAGVPERSRCGHAAERVAASDRLAEDQDVGAHAEPVHREVAPEPAEAGDRLVDDEQPAATVAELAQTAEEAPLGRPVAGGAEDRLDDDRSHTVELGRAPIELGEGAGAVLAAFRVGERVVLLAPRVGEGVHPVDAEADPLLGEAAAAEAHAGGLAVEAAGEGDEVAATAHRLGEADRHLDRLGAPGVERDAVDAGREHAREALEVGGVLGGVEHAGGESLGLPGDRLRPHRIAVADGRDAHGGGEVEQPPAGVGDQVRPLTVGHHQARRFGDAARTSAAEAAHRLRDGAGAHAPDSCAH